MWRLATSSVDCGTFLKTFMRHVVCHINSFSCLEFVGNILEHVNKFSWFLQIDYSCENWEKVIETFMNENSWTFTYVRHFITIAMFENIPDYFWHLSISLAETILFYNFDEKSSIEILSKVYRNWVRIPYCDCCTTVANVLKL